MSRPSLEELTAFAAVAQHRSFRKAADALGVSRSALSHMIPVLEGKLGVRLLNRTTRSVSLTDSGAGLLDRLKPVLEAFEAALDRVAEKTGMPMGPLRINANKRAAQILLNRVVPAFLARYPAVELDLVSEGRFVDIVAEGFDAGVRLAEDVPQDMVGVKLGGAVRFLAVASPAYLDTCQAPTVPDDLAAHRCIRQRLPSGKRYRWQFSRYGREVSIDVPGNLTLDDNGLMLDAALAGLGIVYLPEGFARDCLDRGQLVTVLEEWCPAIPGLMLYYPRNRHLPTSLRAFVDMVKAECRSV